MIELDELLGRAERIVGMAKSRGIQQAEAYLEWGEGLSVEVEKGAVATASSGRSSGGAVRVVQAGKLGFAYFTTDAQAADALDAALRNTRFATVPGYSLPPGTRPSAMPGRWDPAVAHAAAAQAVRLAKDLVAGAREAAPKAVLTGGGVSLDAGACAIASTEGVACADRATTAGVSGGLVLEDGTTSISTGESVSSHRLDVDAVAVGRKAGETAMSLLKPQEVKTPGASDIVLRAEVAAELVVDWMLSAATGDEAMRGKTAWSGRLGTDVAHPGLSLTDNPLAPGALGAAPFDDEGLPVAAIPIVAEGTLRSYLFDSWDAHRHNVATTHSAVRGGFKTRPSTGTHHVVLSAKSPVPMDKLISGVDRGFLVESVLGAHTANATTGDFSVTSPNVWRIEHGAVTGPVRDIAIAGALPGLLAKADGVSVETKAMMGMRIPAVRLRNVDVSV
ncbi:MAG: TldD/PmbA family protein [bacterium]